MHESPTPRVGGLVVFGVSACVFIAFYGFAFLYFYKFLLSSLCVLLIVGFWDDRFGVPPLAKLGAQIASACLLVLWGGIQIDSLGDLFGSGELLLGSMSAPLSILCIIFFINAMNMIDGLDGLCAGIGSIMLLYLENPAWIMVPPLAGFLVWSLRTPWRRRASVFLGDAGSMALGLLVCAAALFSVEPFMFRSGMPPITVAWILALPVMDAAAVLARRVVAGKSPLAGDRGHIHHRLMDAGLSHGQAVAVLLAASAGLGLIGFLPAPEWALAAAWAALCVTHVALGLTKSA